MLMKKNLSDILQFEVKKKSIGFVTLSEIRLANDYNYIRAYVSFLGAKNPKENLEELKKVKGFIKSSLAKKMDIWKIPDIEFILDDSFDRAIKLEEVLNKEAKILEEMKKEK